MNNAPELARSSFICTALNHGISYNSFVKTGTLTMVSHFQDTKVLYLISGNKFFMETY
jgi:hypothetical protein